MRFAEVAGHDDLKSKLVETIRRDRVGHSQLFFGPEGNGALPLALAFAQYLLCENPMDGDSCGKCSACKQVEHFNYPDLHFVFPVARKQKGSDKPLSDDYYQDWIKIINKERYFGLYRWLEEIGVENKQAQISVHESASILSKLSLKSYSGNNKILILWMPERLNASAANKLLKLLEEPPEGSIFLLVSEDPEKLISTITSRCQKVYVPKYERRIIQHYLEQREQLDANAAGVISKIADGNLAEALRLAERAETYHNYALLFSTWVRNCYSVNMKHLVDWSEECGRFEREKLRDFLKFCSNAFRDSLRLNLLGEEEVNNVFREINFELAKFAPFIHAGNTPGILEAIDQAAYDISRNVNARLVLTDLSLTVAKNLRLKP
jgi:DNA polymerase-3 subunit delta'